MKCESLHTFSPAKPDRAAKIKNFDRMVDAERKQAQAYVDSLKLQFGNPPGDTHFSFTEILEDGALLGTMVQICFDETDTEAKAYVARLRNENSGQ